MSERVPRLIEVLELQTELARALIDVLQADQQHVVRQDVVALEESGPRKEGLALRMQAAEQARQGLARELGGELGLDPEGLRVASLCHALVAAGRAAEAGSLESAASTLRAAMASLAELVAVSRGFLEQSILGVRGLLSMLQALRAPAQSTTYDARGRFRGPSDADPVVLRREA